MSKQSKATRSHNTTSTMSTNVLLVLVVIPLLLLLVYANSLHGEFVFDDVPLIVQNPQILGVNTMLDVMRAATNTRGLLMYSYALNYYMFGLDTFSWHVANLLLHIANCIMVFFIIRKFTNSEFAQASGALLFAVHPLLTSAVSSISGRSSLLCATFYFAALLLFLSDRWIYALCCGVLAWYTKQDAVALPMACMVLVFIQSRASYSTVWISPRMAWRYVLGLIFVTAIFFGLYHHELYAVYRTTVENKTLVAAGFDTVLPQPQYFYTYLSAVSGYLIPRMLIPVNLSVDPTIPAILHWYNLGFIISVLMLGSLLYIAYRTRDTLLRAGICLLLFSPLIVYAFAPMADVVLEHRVYIPMLGVAILFGFLSDYIRRSWSLDYAFVSVVTLLIIFSALTTLRNHVWHSPTAFWSSAVQSSPTKPRTHLNLGFTYQMNQRNREAIDEYRIALRLNPNLAAAYSNISALQIDTGDLANAEVNLRRVIELMPQFTEAYVNLAVLHMRRNQPIEAIQYLDHALSINPSSEAARLNKADAIRQATNLGLLGSRNPS